MDFFHTVELIFDEFEQKEEPLQFIDEVFGT